MDENRFSPRAQRALELAERSAGDLGHSYIGTEHLLLGLLREEEGIARRVLEEQGLTESMVQKILINSVGRGIPGTKPTQGLTPRAKRAIESAVEESIAAVSVMWAQSTCWWVCCGTAAAWVCGSCARRA